MFGPLNKTLYKIRNMSIDGYYQSTYCTSSQAQCNQKQSSNNGYQYMKLMANSISLI